MNTKNAITLAAVLAGLLAVAAVPSYSDHLQVIVGLTPGTEAECAGASACISMTAAGLDVGDAAVLDAGGEVIWSNDGSGPITLTSGDAGSDQTGEDFGPLTLNPGQTYSRIFNEGGEFSFHLVDYPWIAGAITVVSEEEHTHEHTGDSMEAGEHSHAMVDAEGSLAIGIDAVVEAKGGVNVHIMTEGWTWTPENVNEEHVPDEGHAHIYVDGVKSRVYGPYYHIPELEPGSHHIRVTLNANTHADMYVNGFPAEAVAMVVVPEHDNVDDPAPSLVAGTASMSVEATAHVDVKGGYNLEVTVTDFVISGENINGDHVDGEGYVMVSIDGEPYNRLYGNWLQLPSLEPGMHTITVGLFSNNHAPYHWNDEPVEMTITVHATEGDDSSGHGH